MSFFISQAHAQATTQQPGAGGAIFQIVFLVGLFALFYFIAIRPQRKRQKEHAEMVAALVRTIFAQTDAAATRAAVVGQRQAGAQSRLEKRLARARRSLRRRCARWTRASARRRAAGSRCRGCQTTAPSN